MDPSFAFRLWEKYIDASWNSRRGHRILSPNIYAIVDKTVRKFILNSSKKSFQVQ